MSSRLSETADLPVNVLAPIVYDTCAQIAFMLWQRSGSGDVTRMATSPADRALVACAVFDTFDHEALRAVLGIDEPTIAEVLGRAEVEPAAPAAGVYRLEPVALPALLDELRRSRPRDEHELHRLAFDHYLERLREGVPWIHPAIDQAACIHHLRNLRDLNLNYMRWHEVTALIAKVRATVQDLQPHAAAQLAIYDAYDLIRQQNYKEAEQRLHELLLQPDLTLRLRAQALMTRGVAQYRQSHFESALAIFKQARATAVEAGDHVAAGRALINQSWIHNELLRFDLALTLSKRSLAQYRQGHDLYGAAYALYAIGNNASYLGEWEVGRRHLDQAAAIYASAGMLGSLAVVDWGLGYLYQVLGDEDASRQAYQRALGIARSPEFGNKVTEADTLTQLGLLYQVQQDWQLAEAEFTRAIELARELGNDHRRALLLHRKALVCAFQGDDQTMLELLDEAIGCIESLRVSMNDQTMKIGLLGTAQQVYESIILAYVDRGNSDAGFDYVERARARAFLDLLAHRDERLAPVPSYRPATLQEVQARLAPDTILLEYFTIGVIPPGEYFLNRIPENNTKLRSQLTSRPEILLFAVTSGGITTYRIDFDPNLLRAALNDPSGAFSLTPRKLSWLYSMLLAPVEHQLAGKRVLHIVPHGPLHAVPFAALRKSDGSTLLAPNSPAVTYAPSATMLCVCLDKGRSLGSHSLTLGYNGDGTTELRFAEREAQLIGEMTEGSVFTGAIPKRAALLRLGPRLRHLHVAGHAVYRSDDPLGSYLRLGDGDNIDARTLMKSLRLDAALVTLNACTTGFSHVASGDELLGLPRAFLYAGAATIICSLHAVDDLAAYVLMLQFFEHLARGLSPGLALQHAQLRLRTLARDEVGILLRHGSKINKWATRKMLRRYDDIPFAEPRYWAPFMVIGKP